MGALDNAVREVVAVAKTSAAASLPVRGAPVGAAPGVLPLRPGVRVLDLVTGKVGVIDRVVTQQLAIPTT